MTFGTTIRTSSHSTFAFNLFLVFNLWIYTTRGINSNFNNNNNFLNPSELSIQRVRNNNASNNVRQMADHRNRHTKGCSSSNTVSPCALRMFSSGIAVRSRM